MRRLLNTAFGTASMAGKRAAEVVNELMREGKISEEEGRKILYELEKEGDDQRVDFEKEMEDLMERVLKKMNIPTRKDFEALEKRVQILESTRRI